MNSLPEIKIKEISSRYILGYDKWYRMCAGISSDLERYEDGIIYLRIKNTEKINPSNDETAAHCALNWRRCNKELREAKGFVVLFYSTSITGFMVRGDALLAEKQLADDLARQFEAASRAEPRLINIFSGLFPPQE